jgi:hypothetical protein
MRSRVDSQGLNDQQAHLEDDHSVDGSGQVRGLELGGAAVVDEDAAALGHVVIGQLQYG